MQADIHKLFPTLEPALIGEIKSLGSIRSVSRRYVGENRAIYAQYPAGGRWFGKSIP